MPLNYVISVNPPSKEKQIKLFNKAERKIEMIMEVLNRNMEIKPQRRGGTEIHRFP